MKVLLKIAFRNISLHKKQSILIGMTLVLAITLVSFISVAINGMQEQVYNNYIKIQSGHVVGIWKDVKEMSSMSPEKLLYLSNKQLEVEDDYINKKAVRCFKNFVEKRSSEVEAVFYQVRQLVTLKTKEKEDNVCTLYSLSEAHTKWMIAHESIILEEGSLYDEQGICISREKAEGCKVGLGDEVEILVKDVDGEEQRLKRTITGIYKNKAQYENYYIFIPEKVAYELVGYDKALFDMARIYLKEPSKAQEFAKALDEELLKLGDELRAEDYLQASIFYTKFYGVLKAFYKVFFGFILGVIAVGLSATTRMNLMSRREEFGTLRAIGYSKWRCYLIIFLEVAILAGIGVGISLTITAIFVLAFGKNGIYVGSGAVTYMLGGESFVPKLNFSDIWFCVGAVVLFAVFTTILPARKLLKQQLTDLLAKRATKKKKRNLQSV